MWLDATSLGRDVIENGFPTVTAACRKHGIDPVTEMIPVAPGAHYSCGGILADLDGRTSLAGLYAAGEAASTGVQGANRLASNSVTEAIIAGRRTGAAIAESLPAAHAGRGVPSSPSPVPGSLTRLPAGSLAGLPGACERRRARADEPADSGEGNGAGAGVVRRRAGGARAGDVAVRRGHAGRRRAGAAP